MVNEKVLHRFIGGWKYDIDDHSEENNTYTKGENGRLFMNNGVLSFTSIFGTKNVLEIPCLKRILGYSPFQDELIIFGKSNKSCIDSSNGNFNKTFYNLYADSFSVNIDDVLSFDSNVSNKSYYGKKNKIVIESLLSKDVELNVSNIIDFDNLVNRNELFLEDESSIIEFNSNFYCQEGVDQEIDFSYLFDTNLNVNNLKSCDITSIEEVQQNDYDVIYRITKSGDEFSYDLLWSGYLGWNLNDKISTENIYENEFKKRVYFTNYRSELKSINLKDKNLANRKAFELNSFQNNLLLNPKIIGKESGGTIKAGSVFFSYRLITENGQVSDFSSLSERVIVLKDESQPYRLEGGSGDETTNTKVRVGAIVQDYEKYREIEMFALHFLSTGVPLVVSLGIKNTQRVVEFTFYGNENTIQSEVTYADIISRSANWKYCSDIKSAMNVLYASGLRNEPIGDYYNKLKTDFALKSWSINGETHSCAINPKPWEYRVIPRIIGDEKFYSVSQRYYKSIRAFDSFTLTVKNKTNEVSFSKYFESRSLKYIDYTEDILKWLETLDLTLFENIKVERYGLGFLISRIDDSINTDISNIEIYSDNTQFFSDYEESIDYNNISINTSPSSWEYGAVSLGYNQGNGIKITFKELKESILKKNTAPIEKSQGILKLEMPSEKRGFFKGEIYRLGIEFQLANGDDLMVIPIGDIQIPKHGELGKDGVKFSNSVVEGNLLKSKKLIIEARVRLDCDIQRSVKSYRLVYVERLEHNKTILCQGISAPLERVLPFRYDYRHKPDEKISNKWMLPFLGGPTYDDYGLKNYDTDPEFNEDLDDDVVFFHESGMKRIVTNRSLFYFDSPDIGYGVTSPTAVSNGSIRVVGKLKTDHTKGAINIGYKDHSPGGGSTLHANGNRMFPAFSNTIGFGNFIGTDNQEPFLVNVSVFSDVETVDIDNKIEFSRELGPGEVIPGVDFDTGFDVSNNSISLEFPYWYHSLRNRSGANEFFGSRNIVQGNRTIMIKSEDDLFTNSFIGNPFKLHTYMQGNPDGNFNYVMSYDTHALINIEMNNRENVYGGRDELAYSKNIFIPLSETIPVISTNNGEQVFDVYGDTYTTLYIRNKTDWSTAKIQNDAVSLDSGSRPAFDEDVFRKFGAWAYAFVVESSLEPKYTHERRFYREDKFDFGFPELENINGAYLQERSLKSSVAKPYRFEDDPEMLNLVSSSDPKFSGEFYDAWSRFRVNNFYELEKKKGVAYNLATYLNQLFVIQEEQTSKMVIDPNAFVQTSDGQVSLKQGDGGNITNHSPISSFGTSIRNSVNVISDSGNKIEGFFFFDERRVEFVKVSEGLFFPNSLSIEMKERFKNDPVIDAAPFFDDKYKESNICIRTESGKQYVISYSEAFGVFNGIYKINSNIFINWNQVILSPNNSIKSYSLQIHELNEGDVLNVFNENKKLVIGFISNEGPDASKIFKHLSGNISLNSNVDKITIKTSLGDDRVIYGDHHRYKHREGFHSVPLKNRNDWSDLRGSYAYFELEITPKDPKEIIRIHDIIIYIRSSYQ